MNHLPDEAVSAAKITPDTHPWVPLPAAEMLARLEPLPAVFGDWLAKSGPVRALAIGVHVPLIEQLLEQGVDEAEAERVVRAGLRALSGHPRYLQAVATEGALRHHLDGSVAGPVADGHAVIAALAVRTREEKRVLADLRKLRDEILGVLQDIRASSPPPRSPAPDPLGRPVLTLKNKTKEARA